MEVTDFRRGGRAEWSAGVLGSVNRMAAAPSRRVEDGTCLLSLFKTAMLSVLPQEPLFVAWLSAT